MIHIQLVTIFILICLIHISSASSGDKSYFHLQCIEKCQSYKCKHDGTFKNKPTIDLWLLQWSCQDDCSYICMWRTVEFFTKQGLHVPQFHGKWPFIRVFGLQEPASVLFSFFNLYAHMTKYLKYAKTFDKHTPMFYTWTYFSIVCSCGWFWSTIFHARDTPLTEMMDYSFAFTIILTILYCLVIRIVYIRSTNYRVGIIVGSIYLSILYRHISHLWSGSINYDYNMKFNIFIGSVTFILTMFWWYLNYQKLPHSFYMGWFTILTTVVTLLEVADFPPIFWVFDAHSLWHAATIPLVPLLYRFINADSKYLKNYYVKLDDHIE